MALAHVHHIKYATFVFHRNPCFKSGCEPQQRALAAPKHPKPSCLFKCARVNQFLNQCAPALLISFPHTHHFSIFSIIIQYPISSSYHSRSHIILKIMLISFPHTHHFSIFSIINIILISFSFSKLCSYHFHNLQFLNIILITNTLSNVQWATFSECKVNRKQMVIYFLVTLEI